MRTRLEHRAYTYIRTRLNIEPIYTSSTLGLCIHTYIYTQLEYRAHTYIHDSNIGPIHMYTAGTLGLYIRTRLEHWAYRVTATAVVVPVY